MDWYVGSFALFLCVLLCITFSLTFIRRLQSSSDRKRAVAWGFDATEPVPADVSRALNWILRWQVIGVAVGCGGGFVVLTLTREPDESDLGSILGWGAAGCALGAILAALALDSRKPVRAGAFARALPAGLTDYVPVLYRAIAWVVVGFSGLQILAGLLLQSAYPSPHPAYPADFRQYFLTSVWMTGGALIVLIIFEIGGRALSQRPQLATTATEAQWGDALRGTVLRLILAPSIFIGCYAAFQSFWLIKFTGSPEWLTASLQVVAGLVAVAVIAAGLATNARRSQRQYLRRLWPDISAEHDARDRENYLASVAAFNQKP